MVLKFLIVYALDRRYIYKTRTQSITEQYYKKKKFTGGKRNRYTSRGRTHRFFIVIIYYGHARAAHGRRELIARRGQDGTGQTNDKREQRVGARRSVSTVSGPPLAHGELQLLVGRRDTPSVGLGRAFRT